MVVLVGLGKRMNDVELPDEVTLAAVYVDEDLIELEAVIRAGHWRGRARAYTVPQCISTFITALERFADGEISEAEFTAGADTGIGLAALRFYKVDRSGHIVCHVRLATGYSTANQRPEEVFRLSIEVKTEAWAVIRFARQLGEMVQTQAGKASLNA